MSDDRPLDLESLLNPDEQHRFRRLCLETSAEELAQLGEVVTLHLDQLREAATPVADLDAANRIGAALASLLDGGHSFDGEQRALIRGAVEYFLLADDASDDLGDALGFDDDARVVNSVLDRIGLPQYRVDLT